MKELLQKISSYNLFNNLLPGTIFAFFLEKILKISISDKNIIITLIIYYFIGLSISRIGSVIIEPIFKKLKIINFVDYREFVLSSKEDLNLLLLSEINNMYRSIVSTFFSIFILLGYNKLESYCAIIKDNRYLIIIFLFFIMYSFSYRKQSSYVTKRIEANKKAIIHE